MCPYIRWSFSDPLLQEHKWETPINVNIDAAEMYFLVDVFVSRVFQQSIIFLLKWEERVNTHFNRV